MVATEEHRSLVEELNVEILSECLWSEMSEPHRIDKRHEGQYLDLEARVRQYYRYNNEE